MSFTAIFRCRNFRQLRNTSVTDGNWGVSGQTGGGVPGYFTHVYKFRDNLSPLMQRGDLYGRHFPDGDTANASLREHGYLHAYHRNCIEFQSSRAFRKHTGKASSGARPCYGYKHDVNRWQKDFRICYVHRVRCLCECVPRCCD